MQLVELFSPLPRSTDLMSFFYLLLISSKAVAGSQFIVKYIKQNKLFSVNVLCDLNDSSCS